MLVQRLHKAERLNRLATYLYIPYQFLQILGYRLVGKRCNYEWRKYRPEPIGPTVPLQHFFALIFPTVKMDPCPIALGEKIIRFESRKILERAFQKF